MNSEETDQQAYKRANQIATEARVDKLALLGARELRRYDLSGVSDIKFVHGRLQFPGKTPSDLAFDPEKLIEGIIAGDMVETGGNGVDAYYPHVIDGELVGKTVFHLGLEDAAKVMRQCGQELGIGIRELRGATRNYSTGIGLFRDAEEWELHARDAAFYIAKKL